MCRKYFKIFIFIQIFYIFKSDWVKISQKNTPRENPLVSNPDSILSSLLEQQKHNIETQGERPSQNWIDHQKRRFQLADSSQKLIVRGTDNLQSSLQVIASPTAYFNSSLKIEKILINPNEADGSNINLEFKVPSELEVKYNKDNISNKNQQSTSDKNLKNIPQKFYKNNESILIEEDGTTSGEQKTQSQNSFSRRTIRKNNDRKVNSSSSEETGKAGKNSANNGKVETSSFMGFLQFLKSLQSNLLSKAKTGITDKIAKLKELRDSLLFNIEDRVMNLWPHQSSQKRSKRGLFEESHTTFPSAETALMTINFLTFAVFLIKLVLQVVNTLRSKHYNFNGFTASNVESLKVGRLKRNAKYFDDSGSDIETTTNILNAVEFLKYENHY